MELSPLPACIDFLPWVSCAATMFNLFVSVIYLEFESIFFFLCRFGVSFSATKYLLGCTGLYTLTCKLMVYVVAYYV
jgi:hypothetical protein